MQEKRLPVELGKSAGDDTTAEIGVDDLVAVQVEPADVERQPDEQGHGTNDRGNDDGPPRRGLA